MLRAKHSYNGTGLGETLAGRQFKHGQTVELKGFLPLQAFKTVLRDLDILVGHPCMPEQHSYRLSTPIDWPIVQFNHF